eukprot:2188098-Pyramimonas_sp.AAC.1
MAQEGACATCRKHMLPRRDCTCALFTGRKPDAAGHRLDFSYKACAVVAFCLICALGCGSQKRVAFVAGGASPPSKGLARVVLRGPLAALDRK